MYRELEAAKLRRRDEADRDLSLAWHVEAFHRQKKLPSLKSLLKQTAQAAGASKQTVGQMRSVLSILSAQYGIPMRRTKGMKVG